MCRCTSRLEGGKAERRRVIGTVLPAGREVAAQGAVGRLLAHVGRQVGAGADEEIIFGASLEGIGVVEKRCERPIRMDVPLCPDEPADLYADVGARHIVEARAVEATDFHVFYWLGLDRKICCLPSRNRNQTGRGAEEEAFHHLHLEPPIVVPCGGFRLWPGGLHPLKAPLVPKTR